MDVVQTIIYFKRCLKLSKNENKFSLKINLINSTSSIVSMAISYFWICSQERNFSQKKDSRIFLSASHFVYMMIMTMIMMMIVIMIQN